MNRIIFIVLAIIGVLLAVLLLAPSIIPASSYKGRIERAASEALGREVTVGDDLSIRIFPSTAFKVTDLTVANAEGFEGPPLARVGEANIGVKLFSLLSGAVEVTRFVLTEPEINLQRAADGRVNWELASGAEPAAEEAAPAERGGPNDIRLGDVRIVDGRASYSDAEAGTSYAAEDINVEVTLRSMREPLEVDGDMTFQGEPTELDLVLTDLQSLNAGEPANLKLDMTIGETSAGADIDLQSGETLSYRGPVDFNAPDLPALAALLGAELADAPGFDRFSFSGAVEGGAEAMRISGARIGFDDISADGDLQLDWSGARPKASGVLSTERLDLRPYMPPPAESASGTFPEWSTEPMDFAGLRNIDASLDLSTNEILLNDLKIGESRLQLTLDDGRLTADIPELAMYGGQGSGRLVVNAREATPTFAGNFDMGAVNAQPLVVDLMKNDNLLGLGSFKLEFTASGASQAAIMSSIDGAGGFDLADGALKGVNLAKLAQAAASLRQGGINPAALTSAVATARGPREETDFSEFLSNFSITDGRIEAPTISLTGPFLTMNGQGVINLPQQTIDLRLAPRATTTADGQAGRSISVPVRVGGTFAKPTIGVDAESLVRAGVEGTLRNFLGGAAGGDGSTQRPEDAVRGAIGGILGRGQNAPPAEEGAAGETADAEEAETPERAIQDGINALFGRRRSSEPATDEEEDAPPADDG